MQLLSSRQILLNCWHRDLSGPVLSLVLHVLGGLVDAAHDVVELFWSSRMSTLEVAVEPDSYQESGNARASHGHDPSSAQEEHEKSTMPTGTRMGLNKRRTGERMMRTMADPMERAPAIATSATRPAVLLGIISFNFWNTPFACFPACPPISCALAPICWAWSWALPAICPAWSRASWAAMETNRRGECTKVIAADYYPGLCCKTQLQKKNH